MKDPTRIDHVIKHLRDAWEGQPNLDFAEFFARLQPHGVARNSSDEELVDVLAAVQETHPWKFEGKAQELTTRATIDLAGLRSDSARIATLDHGTIVIRPHPADADTVQPVVWRYTQVHRCRPGEPLRVEDEAGTIHRLGIVELITTSPHIPQPTDISGITHPADGYVLRFDTGTVAMVGSKLWITTIARRETSHRTLRWEKLETAAVGQTLIVRTARKDTDEAKTLADLGEISEIIPL